MTKFVEHILETTYPLARPGGRVDESVSVVVAFIPSFSRRFKVYTIDGEQRRTSEQFWTLTEAMQHAQTQIADLGDLLRRREHVVAPSFADPTAGQRETARRSNEGY